ncbi:MULTISPECIES: GNAT family N-acetyltransferase [unclassified Streptomyces]|uniref:GNAT family N-acetyltransferase n=1 Tax=unclassified Streptomyces TaxID=2593676 RepID=UPI00224ED29F|nr:MULTISPECIES: GNAT family N-acetyltransferase [unclassified Streptomyces]MCX4784810.1 GNAT family N-acetyltransferase [Streptomyces sp. NBC_01221]WSP66729.1 GNAT family N-acetyltransferase [Streptomyces sp. NBC_01240]
MPTCTDTWQTALVAAGFSADSSLSVKGSLTPLAEDASERSGIRPVNPWDADQIAAIFAQSQKTLADASSFMTYEEEAVEAVRRRVAAIDEGATAAQSQMWVQETPAGDICGAIEARIEHTSEEAPVVWSPAGVTGCIDWIAVADDHRKRGKGSALLAYVEGQLKTKGAQTLYTHHLNGEDGPAGFWAINGYLPAWTHFELAAAPLQEGL